MCAKYLLTLARDRVGGTSQGAFALQYETVVRSEFRFIEMRNLTPRPVSINGVRQLSTSQYSIHAGARSLSVGVSTAGRYSVEVMDPFGRTLHRVQGEGSPAKQEIQMKQSGLYIVKITSSRGTALRKVVVR
jgi:hypothetical protein